MNRIDRLYMEMIHYYQGDPKHIQHFVKVHDLSRLIGQSEGLDEDTMYVLEAAGPSASCVFPSERPYFSIPTLIPIS